MAKVLLSQVEDNYRLLPVGTYEAVVTDVKVEDGDSDPSVNPGGNHKWRVELSLEPGDGKGIVKVTRTLTWYGKALRFAWKDLCTITGEQIALEDNAFDDEEDTHLVMGRHVRVVTEHYTRSDGSEMNTVGSILRPTGSAPAGSGKGSKKGGELNLFS